MGGNCQQEEGRWVGKAGGSGGRHPRSGMAGLNFFRDPSLTSVVIYGSINVKIVLQYYAGTRSLYIQEGRQDKGRMTAPPPPSRCSGTQSCPDASSSLMSGRLFISGRHLILTLPLVRKMKRNTGENEKNGILGCLVKTRNCVKNPSREKPRT